MMRNFEVEELPLQNGGNFEVTANNFYIKKKKKRFCQLFHNNGNPMSIWPKDASQC